MRHPDRRVAGRRASRVGAARTETRYRMFRVAVGLRLSLFPGVATRTYIALDRFGERLFVCGNAGPIGKWYTFTLRPMR